MRGGPAFAVSLVLSALEPALRAAAELGAWQIISPVNALGRVVVVGGLHEVQDEVRARSPSYSGSNNIIFSLACAHALPIQVKVRACVMFFQKDLLFSARTV